MLDQPAVQIPVAQRANPERFFAEDVRALRLDEGEIFRGEGILAVTKAILQSGVAYVGGYQGAPVSHRVDVLVEPQDLLDELGVHLETCTNESSAAALLGASINYPLRAASPGSRSSAPAWRPMRSATSLHRASSAAR